MGVLCLGAGAYLMYYAVRHTSAGTPGKGPIAHATTSLGALTGTTKKKG